IKRPRDLGPSKGTVVEISGIVTSKGDPLGHTLVDDIVANHRQPVYIRFAGPEIPALNRVMEEPEDAVAVTGIVFGRVYASLGRNTVSTAGAILVTEGIYFIAEFPQCCSSGRAGKTGAHYDDPEFPLVCRIDQPHFPAMSVPFFSKRARWTFSVKDHYLL